MNEWENIFNKDGRQLLVVFAPRSRRVSEFFLAGDDKAVILRWGNLVEGAAGYRLEPVKAIRSPSKITGVKVFPRR